MGSVNEEEKESAINATKIANDLKEQAELVKNRAAKFNNTFKDLLEFSDPSVFWMIASVVVLNSLEGEDEGLA